MHNFQTESFSGESPDHALPNPAQQEPLPQVNPGPADEAGPFLANISTKPISSGFSKMLEQEFLVLRRKAAERRDGASVESLNTIIDGFRELSRTLQTTSVDQVMPLLFDNVAFDIFSNLARYPNDFLLHRKAGEHYLTQWRLPHAALGHFKRASGLNPSEKTLPMLIEIATLAIKRKNDPSTQGLSSEIKRLPQAKGNSNVDQGKRK